MPSITTSLRGRPEGRPVISHPDLRFLAHDNRLGIGAWADPVNHDLVVNPVTMAEAAAHTLSYHGGPTMPHPKAWLVFLNDFWADWQVAEVACRDIMEGGYLSGLTAYGSGNGTFLGSIQVSASIDTFMTDSQIRAMLGAMMMTGELPPPDDETLYILCMPTGVRVVFDGESRGSCETWCGYHYSGFTPDNRRFIYSVQPATNCGPCGGDFDSWTMVLAHEIAEAVTDPFGTGWWDSQDGSENADIVAWVEFTYGPHKVQGYWTNEHDNTMGQYIPVEQRPGNQPPPPEPEPPPDPRTYDDGVAASRGAVNRLLALTKPSNTVRKKALREAVAAVEGLLI